MSERVNYDAGLIDAIALAIARALSAHGVTPADGNATVHERCAELCAYWGGDHHWVPETYKPGRDHQVIEAVQRGVSYREVARRVGVHHKTVSRIIKRQPTGFGRDDWVL